MEAEPDPVEAKINAVVDATPVFTDPDIDDPALHRFIEDVAQGIHKPITVATRYGFASEDAMIDFIARHSEVRRRIKVRRAIWESDDSVEVRARKLSGYTVLEALPQTGAIMFDPNLPASTRLDALKAHARMAGLDGVPAAEKGGGQTGSNFAVNIMFSGGRVERIATTVVDAEPPALPEPAP